MLLISLWNFADTTWVSSKGSSRGGYLVKINVMGSASSIKKTTLTFYTSELFKVKSGPISL